ncbi:Lecithin:cholesterol acyltransferase [Pelomyxa schiedti]|nr:Lecithin:cholesterol acyltransferase [Pelomyxa schiedti]
MRSASTATTTRSRPDDDSANSSSTGGGGGRGRHSVDVVYDAHEREQTTHAAAAATASGSPQGGGGPGGGPHDCYYSGGGGGGTGGEGGGALGLGAAAKPFAVAYSVATKRSDIIVYCFHVRIGTKEYHVAQRYSDFRELHKHLKSSYKVKLAEFPSRTLRNSTNQKTTRELRRRMFYIYLNEALEYPQIREDPCLLEFLSSTKLVSDHELSVEVLAARGLNLSTDDPICCKLGIYNAVYIVEKEMQETDPASLGSGPSWLSENFTFCLESGSTGLQLSLWTSKLVGSTFLGSVMIRCASLPQNKVSEHWFPLHATSQYNKPISGELHLRLYRKSPSTPTSISTEPVLSPQIEKLRLERRKTRMELLNHKAKFGSTGCIHISYTYSPPQYSWEGALYLELIGAKNLSAHDLNGFSDPYCVIKFGRQTFKTDIQKKTLNPTWNEKFFMIVSPFGPSDPEPVVTIEVWDWDRFGSGDIIGTMQLILPEVIPNTPQDVWCDIYADPSEENVNSNVARAMHQAGWRPHFPVVLVPGFASSELKVKEGLIPKWQNEVVWLSLTKIGTQTFKLLGFSMSNAVQKLSNQLSKVSNLFSNEENDDNPPASKTKEDVEFRNMLLTHVCLDPNDGRSDPPKISLRAVEEKIGLMYLDPSTAGAPLSWVMGPLVETLQEFGYNDTNLAACPYDWRLDPQYLEERDHYFSKLKQTITTLVATNHLPVCILGHSMGNRTIQYFLNMVKSEPEGQQWLDSHIHTFIAVGAPFLGAAKPIRALCTGDRLGLDALLSNEDAIEFGRSLSSVPFLLPVGHSYYFHDKSMSFVYLSDDSGTKPVSISSALSASGATKSQFFFDQYYLKNPLFGGSPGFETILQPPPVKRLYAIYGIDLPTEKIYFYKKTKSGTLSFNKKPDISLEGYKIRSGIGYETPETPQPSIFQYTGIHGSRSGDGTVPYESLSYCSTWKASIPEVTINELSKVEHRDILKNKLFFQLLIDRIALAPANVQPLLSEDEPPLHSHSQTIDPSLLHRISFSTPSSSPVHSLATETVVSPSKTASPEIANVFSSSQVLRAGFLFKQGEITHKWKRKYFVLQSESLSFYSTPSSTTARGTVLFSELAELRPTPFPIGGIQQQGFVMVTKQEEEVRICSNNAEDTESWLKILTQVWEQHKPTASTPATATTTHCTTTTSSAEPPPRTSGAIRKYCGVPLSTTSTSHTTSAPSSNTTPQPQRL